MAATDSVSDVVAEGSDRRPAPQRLLLGLPSRRRMRETVLKLSDLSAVLAAFVAATLLVVVPGQLIPLEEFLAIPFDFRHPPLGLLLEDFIVN